MRLLEVRNILLFKYKLLESTLEKKYNLTVVEVYREASKVYDWKKQLISEVGEDGEPYGLL